MQTARTRHRFYLPDALSAKLDTLAEKPGASKTAILTDALSAWLERGALSDLDERFGLRLDRQSRASDQIEQKLDLLTETLGVFIQFQMTLTAHQPLFPPEAVKLGREGYESLMSTAARRLAKRGSDPMQPIKRKELDL